MRTAFVSERDERLAGARIASTGRRAPALCPSWTAHGIRCETRAWHDQDECTSALRPGKPWRSQLFCPVLAFIPLEARAAD